MLNYAGIDKTLLNYIVDLNPFKSDRYPYSDRLPIILPSKLLQDKSDCILLAENFAEEIRRQQGDRLIVSIPASEII